MTKLTIKIASSILLTGLFIIAALVAVLYGQLDISLYIIILLLLMYTIFFSLAASKRISNPIKKILDEATELSKGNLSSRVYLETKDELAELATVLNKLAEELQTSREQQENLEKSVSIKVKAKTRELEETINALEQKIKNRTIELERLMKEKGTK